MCTQKMTYLLLIDLFLVLLARRCTQTLGNFNINNVVEPLYDTHAGRIYDEASQYIMVFWNYEFFVAAFFRSRFMHKKKKNHHRTHKSLDLLLRRALIDTIYGI